MPCLALEVVNEAINPATHALTTAVEGGSLVEAEDEESESHQVSAVFAQAFQGPELNHVIITNRSDLSQDVQLDGLAQVGWVHTLAGEHFTWRIAGGQESPNSDEICRPDGDLERSAPVEWLGELLSIPAWGVVRVDIPRSLADIPIPSGLNVTVDGRTATATWDAVDKAIGYELRWGVANGMHHYAHVQEPQHTLSGLGAGVTHRMHVAARTIEDSGPFSNEVAFTPTRPWVFTR